MFTAIADFLFYLVPGVAIATVLVVLTSVLRRWRPQRLLARVPSGAIIRSRCMFGGVDWFRQGIAYVLDDALILSDGKDQSCTIPLRRIAGLRESLNFPASFAERLHGFHFDYDGEALWFAVPNHVVWREHLPVAMKSNAARAT